LRTADLVARFSRDYDEHVFKEKGGLSFCHLLSVLEIEMTPAGLMHKGNESQAVLEFSPYQKLPLEKTR